jgi:uncharacterized membrane protein YeaQ/YmgE (transglycosylase-associated protein family)
MEIFLESPWPWITIGILLEGALALALFVTRRGVLLYAMIGVLLAVVAGVLFERWVITERKRVIMTIEEGVEGLKSNSEARMDAVVSPTAEQTRRQIQTGLGMVHVTDVSLHNLVGWVERSEPHQEIWPISGGARCARPTLPSIFAPRELRKAAQVDDLRLDGRPGDRGPSLGQHGRGEDVGRAGDRRASRTGHRDRRAHQAVGAGDHVAVLDPQIGPQGHQARQVQVHRPWTDVAAAGQRDHGLSPPGQERSQHAEAGPHPPHQLVVGPDRLGIDGPQHDRVILGPPDLDPELSKEQREGIHVGQPGDAFQPHRSVGQDRRGHHRQRGVLGSSGADRAAKPLAAKDAEMRHDGGKGFHAANCARRWFSI